MAAPADEPLPTRSETVLAYACAALSSLVWMGGVIPGTWAAGDVGPDDRWTPLARGAPLLLPALMLLIAGPISAVLCRGPTALRALLAAGDAYVTGVMAVALWATHDKDPAVLIAIVFLAVICLFALRDAFVVVKDGAADAAWAAGDPAAPPASFRTTDVRLALSMLVLLTPAQLFAEPHRERASLLAPFAYVAISALGSRFSTTERSLRLAGAVLVSLVASHLVVAVRYVLDEGEGAGRRWTWAGTTTFLLACAVLIVSLARVIVVLRGPPGLPAASFPPDLQPAPPADASPPPDGREPDGTAP